MLATHPTTDLSTRRGSVAEISAATRRAAAGRIARARLLGAAVERLTAAGPDASFDDVVVSKGALYHHFSPSDQLVEEVYKEAVRRHAERVVTGSSRGTGGGPRRGLAAELATLYGSETPFYRLLLRLHVKARASRPYLAPTAHRVQARQRDYMTSPVCAGRADGSTRDDVRARAVSEMINTVWQTFVVRQVDPPRGQRVAAEEFGDLLEALL
jgi:AcrR family transcriptional regulator